MDEEKFKQIDEKLMAKFKSQRDKKVPWEIMKGFSASVENKLRERDQKTFVFRPSRAWLPAAVPVFAVMVLASWVVLRTPATVAPVVSPAVQVAAPLPVVTQLAQVSSPIENADMAEEIAALREIGAWTDDDQDAIGAIDELDLEQVELSDLNSQTARHLA